MTAVKILERLGADASLTPSDLSEEENQSIAKALHQPQTYNAVLIHTSPEPEPEPEPEDDEEEQQQNEPENS